MRRKVLLTVQEKNLQCKMKLNSTGLSHKLLNYTFENEIANSIGTFQLFPQPLFLCGMDI